MSSLDQAGLLSTGSGLLCRIGPCRERFQPRPSPVFLRPRTREMFDTDALQDAIKRRNEHERNEHSAKVEAC